MYFKFCIVKWNDNVIESLSGGSSVLEISYMFRKIVCSDVKLVPEDAS